MAPVRSGIGPQSRRPSRAGAKKPNNSSYLGELAEAAGPSSKFQCPSDTACLALGAAPIDGFL